MPVVSILALLVSRVAVVDLPSLQLPQCNVADATGPLTAMTIYNEFGCALLSFFTASDDNSFRYWFLGGGNDDVDLSLPSWDWPAIFGAFLSLFYLVVLCCWLATAPRLAQSSAPASSGSTTVSSFIGSLSHPVISSLDTGLSSSPSSLFSFWSTPAQPMPFRSASWDSEEAVPIEFPFLLQEPRFAHVTPASAGFRTMLAYCHYVHMKKRVNDFADGLERHLVNEILPLPRTPSFARPRAFPLTPFFVYESAYSQYVDFAPDINEFADDIEHRHAELFTYQ